MAQCIKDLRDGLYGNDAWREWVANGKPLTGDGKRGGPRLSATERRTAAVKRFGKGKTEDDWLPRDCHRPINCNGLVEKAKAEANAMIAKIDGLAGTLDNLFVEDGAKFVDAEILNSSDLTGVPADMRLVGNDVVTDEQGNVQADSTVADDDADEQGETEEVEDSTELSADGQTRTWPAGSIEPGREEDQQLHGNHCLCCNAYMGSDPYLVCVDCGGGL